MFVALSAYLGHRYLSLKKARSVSLHTYTFDGLMTKNQYILNEYQITWALWPKVKSVNGYI
jgi:hypothetical protein